VEVDYMDYMDRVKEASQHVKKQINTDSIDLAIILGSGLGSFGASLDGTVIPYNTIPHFPVGNVKGHENRLIFAPIADKNILCFQGRIHYYEGHSIENVVFPVRMMKELGVKRLLITNSAGGINKNLKPGNLMLISDHINLMGVNPLVGSNLSDHGKRFPDMSHAYSRDMIQGLKSVSPIPLLEGVYMAVSGPSYETPAEINFFRSAGADAIGMSTVPENIVANHCGIETAGISVISNFAAGISDGRLSHEDVIEVGKRAETDIVSLILNYIGIMH
jgi:purine-nucleoside phosphorylase